MGLRNMHGMSMTVQRRLWLLALLGLAACTTAPGLFAVGTDVMRHVTQYSLGRLDRLWAAPPAPLVMIQRQIGSESQQLIALENTTTLEGDNFLLLIARLPDGRNAGRFILKDFIARVGGAPYPFRTVSESSLRSAEDSAGSYFWLQYNAGAQTSCVLAFRRLEGSARVLPSGTNVMEALLRNCVVGTVEEALLPILGTQISVGTVATATSRTGDSRMLSPLAAPPL